MAYWFLYKDWDDQRGLFYNGEKVNLKYTLDPAEAEEWYEKNKKLMVMVNIKRPPNLEIPTNIPLWTDKLLKQDIDTKFLTFITRWAISTRMEFILNRFMNNYHLSKDWIFYRREIEDDSALHSTRNILALCMMKDIILGIFRIHPLKIPAGKNKKNLNKTEYIEWDIWEDFSIEYEVQGTKYQTNLFGVYKPKLFEAMLADTWRQFNWFCLQNWQMMVWLLSWWVTYVIWPRWWGKSLYINWDMAGYLLKDITDNNERVQEWTQLYMGLSQKQNAPYMVYSQQMLNNLIDLPSFCNKLSDWTGLYIVDWDKQRKLEYVTTNQNDPTRSRRTRKFVWDEADYLDWDYVGTAMSTADSLVTLISTIGPNTQAGNFYRGWLNAYKNQRNYEPIDVLIHDIWIKYWLHLCKSRKDYERKIRNWDFERMRAEFIQRRPEVALHFTMDDVEFLTEEQKDAQVSRVLNARGYDYMLAEYYGEYSTDQTVFNVDWVQQSCPSDCDYRALGYDEADTFDNPGLCILWAKEGKYYIKETLNLSKESNQRFAKMKDIIQGYKNTGKPTYLIIDASRWWAAARELWLLWMPCDMLIKWTGNVTYQPWARHNVGKAWCIEMIKNSFFDTNILYIDPACYGEWGLVEELSHFKKRGASARWEKKIHDDQVASMLLVLYFCWFHDQLATKDVVAIGSQKSNQQIIEELWAERFQKPKDTATTFLDNLKSWLF